MALTDVRWLQVNNITWDVDKCHAKAGCNDEGGIDIGYSSPTTITALCTGPLVGAGNYWGHGVVTQQCNVPGLGKSRVYYQHIAIDGSIKGCRNGNCGGQIVQRGQPVGVARWGLVETGINPPWGGIWGQLTGGWVQHPIPYLQNLAGAPATAINYSAGTTTILPPPVAGTTFFNNILNKALLFLVALTLIGAGAYLTFTKQINSAFKTGVKVAAL